MRSHRTGISKRAAVFGAAVAVVLIAAAGSPSMAAHHDEYKGWFVSLDAASTQPTGVDSNYATLIDQTTGFQESAKIENDSDFTWALKVGYSWGNLGGLAVSYWSFDNETTQSKSDETNAVYPLVFGGYAYNAIGTYGLFPSAGYPVNYEVTSKIKASTLDLDYFRPMRAGEKMTINWIAGLRSATWEETRTFNGAESTYPYFNAIVQENHNKADAFGVKVGANAIFGFTDHFSLQALYSFSFMQGKNDAQMDSAITPALATAPTLDQITSTDDKVNGEIRDYDIRAVWTWDRFDVYAGYGGQTWDGLVADPSGEELCCSATRTVHSSRGSVAFNSAHAGVTFRFGKK